VSSRSLSEARTIRSNLWLRRGFLTARTCKPAALLFCGERRDEIEIAPLQRVVLGVERQESVRAVFFGVRGKRRLEYLLVFASRGASKKQCLVSDRALPILSKRSRRLACQDLPLRPRKRKTRQQATRRFLFDEAQEFPIWLLLAERKSRLPEYHRKEAKRRHQSKQKRR